MKYKFCKLFILGILLTVAPCASYAQYAVNFTSGTTLIDGCQHPNGTIYDDGGLTGNYSNSFNGTVIISVPTGVTITLSGNYDLESPSWDYIYVYDGYGETGSVLVNRVGNTGSIDTSSSTGYMTITFHTDGSVNYSGFALQYTCVGVGSMCTNIPSSLTVSNITTNSALLSWTASNPNGPFMLSINGNTNTSNTNSYSATGLSQGGIYEVQLSSLQDSLSGCCKVKKYFRTSCNFLTHSDLPYLYGFEDATGSGTGGSIDTCWTRLSNMPRYPIPTTSSSHAGFYSMNMLSSTSSDYSILVLPEYVDTISNLMLQFWLYNNSTTGSSAKVSVGVMSNPMDESTFVQVASVRSNDVVFEKFEVSLASYFGTGRFVALKVSGSQNVYVDDVKLYRLPECPDVTNLQIESVSATSIAVSWGLASSSMAIPSGYEIIATPTAGGSSVSQNATRSPAIVSGLQPETEYSVRVRVLCNNSTYGGWDSIVVNTSCYGFSMSSPSGVSTNTASGVPVYSGWGNTFCQSIYTATELRAMGLSAGVINKMSYTWTVNSNYAKQFTIFLSTTPQSYFSSSTPLSSGLTQVYSGYHPINTSGTIEYSFATPYYWDGVSNLIVSTFMNQPSGESHYSSGFYAYSTYGSSAQSIYCYRDGSAYAQSDIAALSCNTSYYRANVSFSKCSPVMPDCVAPMVIVDSVGSSDALISWSPGNNENSWNVEYRKESESSWTVAASNFMGTQYHFVNLESGTLYEFRVTSICSASTEAHVVQATTNCRNNGFNYDDLWADNVVCRYGTFSNPDMTEGVVNYGSSSNLSRHTVHTDKNELDGNTCGGLHTVPDGYCSSVRLGNWSTGSQAESITYSYTVDTNDRDLLLLKYAAVMEDPNHSPSEQPRFTFNITDSVGNTISACYSADFIANANLGWNQCGGVLWKDWTTVGVDLSPMHGQTIYLKLTTYDCSQSGHYGYAYFVIDIDNKSLRSNSCQSEENVFYAPSGFSYRWYEGNAPSATLSTADTLHVYTEGSYYCDLSFVGAPNDEAHANCFFTMMAISGVRYPYARFTPVMLDTSTCRQTWLRMINESIITRDSAHLDSIANGCESYVWYFDDGTSSTEINPRHGFVPGYHTVTLYAMLANGACADTVSHSFLVVSPCMRADTVYHTMCEGDTYIVFDSVLTSAGEYLLDSIYTNDSVWLRTVFLTVLPTPRDTVVSSECVGYIWPPTGLSYTVSGLYSDTIVRPGLCDSILFLDLTVIPDFDTTIYGTTCSNQPYPFEGNTYTATGVYPHSYLTADGCDSVRTLDLTVFSITHSDTLANECDQFVWRGIAFTASDTMTALASSPNAAGCDSTVTLHLTIRHSTSSAVFDTVFENDLPHIFNGTAFTADTSNMPFTLANSQGCDSNISYSLHVLRNSYAVFDTSFCADRLPLQWYHRIFYTAGTQHDTLVNHVGADSLLTLTLGVWPVYHDTVPASICDNQSYSFEGQSYTAAGHYPHIFSTAHGCDSVRTLSLTVRSTTHGDTLANECDQFVWRGIAFTASDTMTALASSPNAAGCDSTVTLHLTIRHSTSSAVFDTVFENDLPHTFNGTSFATDTSNVLFTLVNSQGCDSLVSYNLHVLRNSYAIFDTNFCADRLPIQWYHRVFYTAGTQHDTLVNHLGADSLLTLTLGVWPVYHDTMAASICDNQSYTFEGQTYTAAGCHPHVFATTHGCDSLRTLSLTVRSTTHGDTLANECDQFVWHGNAFTASNTMTALAATPNAAGCDSTVTLHLTIRHSTDSSFAIESCDSYDWHGTTYLAPPTGVPTHTIANSAGCDSVMRLASLVLHYRQHLYDTAAICENQLHSGYAWRDTAFSSGTASGSYAITRPDQYGCDSIMHLSLTVRTNTAGTQYDTIVENQASSWQYHGTPVSSDTSLSITIANQWGCDSVVAYHLFVWPNVATMADTHICDNRTADFSWYGQPYADTLVTVLADQHGADSTVTLVVHLDSTFRRDIYDTICADQSVAFGGRDYSHSGDYEHTFPSQQLCDSVVTLHLTVHPTFSLDYYDTVYVGDTIVFDGIYEFVEPGDYPIHYLTEHGCDSLVTLHIAGRNLLFVHRADSICEGDTLYFAGNPLTAPGTYIDTVLSGSFISGDTIVELELSVLQRPDISIKREYVCDAPAHYVLTGRTNAPYLNWLGYGVTEGHEHDSVIAVLNPSDAAIVTLEVDYSAHPVCPTTLDMELTPIAVVQALIDVRPTAMTLEERHVTATNVSSGPVQSHRWYVFYNDDLPFTDTARRLSLQVPMYVDSVLLVLEVSSEMCRDNDSVLVDVLRSDILFPNVFTPSLSTNNRFHAYTTAVTEFELWIYDRRGDLMFHTTDIDEAWDGTSGGTPCQQGAYVYKCRYRDEVTPSGYQTVTGTVTLLR